MRMRFASARAGAMLEHSMLRKEFSGFCMYRAKMVLRSVVILICIVGYVACFEVPDEWKEQIQQICSDAEKGIFLHPSMDAQRVYSRSSNAQVPPQVRVWILLFVVCITFCLFVRHYICHPLPFSNNICSFVIQRHVDLTTYPHRFCHFSCYL